MSGTKSALVVANSQYEHSGLRQLTAPTRDAEALAEVLGNAEIGGFQVKTIINQRCADVMHEIEKFFSGRTWDDLLLLYFSGHGLKDEDGKLYLATLNTDPQWLRSTAIPDHFVNQVMSSSRSKRQVMLLDCCYSGAFAKSILAKGEAKVILKDHFEGRGRVLLTASDAIQFSFEAGDTERLSKNPGSVFTRALVAGLKTGEADRDGDGFISLDELYDFVHERVQDTTPNQRPMKWAFDVEGDILIARNPAPFVQPAELPAEIRDAMNSKFAGYREEAVHHLERLLVGKSRGLSVAARSALQVLTQDDSRRVSEAATKCLAANLPAASAPRPIIQEFKAAPRIEPAPQTISSKPEHTFESPRPPRLPTPKPQPLSSRLGPEASTAERAEITPPPIRPQHSKVPPSRRSYAKTILAAAIGLGLLAGGVGILINSVSKRGSGGSAVANGRLRDSASTIQPAENIGVQAPSSLVQSKENGLVPSKVASVIQPATVPNSASSVGFEQPGSPKTGVATQDTESDLAGRKLLDKIVEGMGGSKRVFAVHSFRAKTRGQVSAMLGNVQGSMETLVVFPDRVRLRLTGNLNTVVPVQVLMTRVLNGNSGWQELSRPNSTLAQNNPFAPNNPFVQNSAGPMRQPLSFDEIELMRRELRTHPIWVAQNIGQPGYSVTAAGTAQVDGNQTRVLDVLAAEAEVRWFVDDQTGHIVRSLKKALDPDGLSQEITDARYSDWRSFNGLMLPTREVDTHPGAVTSGVSSIEILDDFEVNPAVDDSVFRQPSDW